MNLRIFVLASLIITITTLIVTRRQEINVYDTTTTSKSLFADGQAYFSADKSPGKISVKPLSIFQKMITETCKELNLRITSITPLGPGVMINGEMCYGAIHITHAPISTFTGKKGSL